MRIGTAALFLILAFFPALAQEKLPKEIKLGRNDPRKYLKELQEAAKSAEKSGVWEDAIELYGRIYFMDPRQEASRAKFKAMKKKQSEALVKRALEEGKKEEIVVVALLKEAIRLDPKNGEAKNGLTQRGYQLKSGEWFTAEELSTYEANDVKRGEKRRAELGLGENFTIVRRDEFRLFTDIKVEDARDLFDQMMNAIRAHYEAYREIMEPFHLRNPSEGLDIVLFEKEKDYKKLVEIEGTAGVYIFGKAACFFFKGSGYDFSTMLHEMTHQLNDKLLCARRLNAWYEEGISEYFGAATFTQKGTRITLGQPNGNRKGAFAGAVRGRHGEEAMPFSKFLNLKQAELTGVFYAQGWALTHYLMETHPMGRMIVYDMITRAKRELEKSLHELEKEHAETEETAAQEEEEDSALDEPPVTYELDSTSGWIEGKKFEEIVRQYGYAGSDEFEQEFLLWHRIHL